MSTPKLIKFRGAVYRKVARPFIAPTAPVLPQPGEKLSPEQQLQLLKYSVEKWNQWYNSVDEPADLRGADLYRAHLSGANLELADFTGADLTGAVLNGADLCGAEFRGTDLVVAYLTGAKYNNDTAFPAGFSPKNKEMVKV